MVFSLFPLSSLTDTSDHIVVVDGVFRLLHTGFQRTKAPGNGEGERTGIVPGLPRRVFVADGFSTGVSP